MSFQREGKHLKGPYSPDSVNALTPSMMSQQQIDNHLTAVVLGQANSPYKL